MKEKIKLSKSINCGIDNLLCMLNNRCLCVGGADKLTLIDVANKIIMNEIFDMGIHLIIFWPEKIMEKSHNGKFFGIIYL